MGEMPMRLRVLVADDDGVFRALICDIVRQQGYEPIEAADGKQAIDLFFGGLEPDLVILDVMMPVYDGWEVLAEIRAHSDTPVMMLTALGDEQNEVAGLQHGADDYLAKPFRYAVFVARINALLRKTNREQAGLVQIGRLCIDTSRHLVQIDEQEISLSNKEYRLLLLLAQNRGIVLSRDRILEKVWGYDFDKDERTVDTHIKTLRQKLERYGDCIQTVRGAGYRFELLE